ncbi:hypothetical protein KUL42_20550 [Alteromonas sp. KUL42]|nr:hypothetical protein KUL42_20550 [Alteromonas sp. KUL42]
MEVMNNQQAFGQIKRILDNHSTLLDAYGLLEPIILHVFDAQRMSIFQRRRQHQDLVARFKTGKETLEIKVPISPMSIAGYVALSQNPVVIDDPYNPLLLQSIHPRLRFADKFDKDNDFKTQNILCVPIMNAGVLMGVIQIINKNSGPFTEEDLQLGNTLALILGDKFRFELGGTHNPFDSLVHKGLLSESALNELQESSSDIRTLVQRLISEYRIAEQEIGQSLSIHYQVPFIGFLT